MAEEVVEGLKQRCMLAIDKINGLPVSKLSGCCKDTLLKSLNAELRFLSRFSSSSPLKISSNIGYFESVIYVLQQPAISGVSRVLKRVPLSAREKSNNIKDVHVDIICAFDGYPAWFIISDRNPKYISWLGSQKNKGLKERIELILLVARSTLSLKPDYFVLFFANGLESGISERLQEEFDAVEVSGKLCHGNEFTFDEVEEDWVNLIPRTSGFEADDAKVYEDARAFQLKIDLQKSKSAAQFNEEKSEVRRLSLEPSSMKLLLPKDLQSASESSFYLLMLSLQSNMKSLQAIQLNNPSAASFVNLDTTALVALVSGISNGCAKQLLAAPEVEMRKRFKSNYQFVISQVISELEKPILEELRSLISDRICIICHTVHSEFKELVSMCGGPNEKLRADFLLKHLMLVPDDPSARMMDLPTTRKIALKNKIVFGTGDNWNAPTLTANMGFVRAICQTDYRGKEKEAEQKLETEKSSYLRATNIAKEIYDYIDKRVMTYAS